MTMRKDYGECSFKVGHRVEIHPGYDLWMQGARFGVVKKVFEENGVVMTKVKMDHRQVKKQIKIPMKDLKPGL